MAVSINMPRLGLDENENVLGEWFVSDGDQVEKGDALFSIETDKSSMTVYAEEAGTVLKRLYETYDVVPVTTPVCIIGSPGEDISGFRAAVTEDAPAKESNTPVAPSAKQKTVTELEENNTRPNEAIFSPRAKALADVNGIAADRVIATGAENRILEEDVIRAIGSPALTGATESVPVKPQPAIAAGEGKRVKLSTMRRAIAKNMMNSMLGTAQTTTHMRYNASKIQAYRAWLKTSPGAEREITLNDLIVYATVRTLVELSYMNAHIIDDEEMILYDEIHIGCAVDTERGLMVPTVKNAHKLGLAELSASLKALAHKCKDGSITPEELSGATFTLSNVGTAGVTYFTPILNPPQIGILGVGTIDYAVKRTDDGMLYYPAGYLSLTYDHRAVDGAPTAKFLQAVCKNLENFDALCAGGGYGTL